MKRKALISIVFILSVIFIYAQSPQAFKYQAVLRDAQGYVRQNESVVIKISIRQGSGSGTEVFSETHNTQTNEFGLVNLNIGTINPSGFASIDWSNGTYYIKIFVDGTEMGTSQLLSVPYEMHTTTAEYVDDADADPTNEIQVLSQTGYNVTLSLGGGTISIEDNDADSTNEIQTLSISNDTIFLTEGGYVVLPPDSGLTLPYSGTYNGSSTAFEIISTGTGNSADFEINNTGSNANLLNLKSNGTNEVLVIDNNGTGSSIFIDNDVNSSSGISIAHHGVNEAMKITNYTNTTTLQLHKVSGSGRVFEILNTGTGDGAFIETDNPSNGEKVLYLRAINGSSGVIHILNEGNGESIYIENNNTEEAIEIHNLADNEAIRIDQNGNDNAVRINNWGNNNALDIQNYGTGYAGYFDGDVHVNGTLSKSGGTFLIDHPLDPENKILRHSFAESPEMMNIYKGRAKLIDGVVIIKLPDYFDALNHPEHREINLTPVNGWSPLYLDGKIANNQFVVKTTEQGNPEQEFSWVIYAVRNDKWAQDHPLIVEEEKGINSRFEKGKLLYKSR